MKKQKEESQVAGWLFPGKMRELNERWREGIKETDDWCKHKQWEEDQVDGRLVGWLNGAVTQGREREWREEGREGGNECWEGENVSGWN